MITQDKISAARRMAAVAAEGARYGLIAARGRGPIGWGAPMCLWNEAKDALAQADADWRDWNGDDAEYSPEVRTMIEFRRGPLGWSVTAAGRPAGTIKRVPSDRRYWLRLHGYEFLGDWGINPTAPHILAPFPSLKAAKAAAVSTLAGNGPGRPS